MCGGVLRGGDQGPAVQQVLLEAGLGLVHHHSEHLLLLAQPHQARDVGVGARLDRGGQGACQLSHVPTCQGGEVHVLSVDPDHAAIIVNLALGHRAKPTNMSSIRSLVFTFWHPRIMIYDLLYYSS